MVYGHGTYGSRLIVGCDDFVPGVGRPSVRFGIVQTGSLVDREGIYTGHGDVKAGHPPPTNLIVIDYYPQTKPLFATSPTRKCDSLPTFSS
jgi:hypothetical protein